MENEESNLPLEKMEHARVLAGKGLYDESLKEFLWCFDHGLEHQPSFYAVRLSFLLGYIADLGGVYPLAIEALKERRDRVEPKVLSGIATFDQAAEFTAINHNIGDDHRTLAAYDILNHEGSSDKKICEMMLDHVFDLLVDSKRYAHIILALGNLPERVEASINRYERTMDRLAANYGNDESYDRASLGLRQLAIEEASKYYEVLLGVGMYEQVAQVANRVLEFDRTGYTYAVLIKRAIHADANDKARALVAEALASLAEDEQEDVRSAAKSIPK